MLSLLYSEYMGGRINHNDRWDCLHGENQGLASVAGCAHTLNRKEKTTEKEADLSK